MERRWFRWGFTAEDVEAGDVGENGRWQVRTDETLDDLVQAQHRGG